MLVAVGVAAPASADPVADLYGMLPDGYDEGVCQPVDVPPNDPNRKVAILQCGPNSMPGGPIGARYIEFADKDAVAGNFQAYVNSDMWQTEICPGETTRIISVMTPGHEQLGLVACGRQTNDPGPPHLIFIHGLMFGNAIGADFQSLLQWMAKSRALGEKLNW